MKTVKTLKLIISGLLLSDDSVMSKTSYLLSLALFFFTSCATITRGTQDKLRVVSEPSGANVSLSSGEQAITPAQFSKSRRGEHITVTVSKPGYISQTVKVDNKMSATGGVAMAGSWVLGGVIGVGIDAATGAYSGLYPNPVAVNLVSRGKSAAAEENSAERVPNRPATVASRVSRVMPENIDPVIPPAFGGSVRQQP